VLEVLVEKTETIHRQLGSAGQVLSDRIADLLARNGLRDTRVTDEIDALEKDPRVPDHELARLPWLLMSKGVPPALPGWQ
jgi:hypothetical protein